MPASLRARLPPANRGPVGQADEEAGLIERAKTDRQAFAVVYDRYFDPVYWYCRSRLGDPDAAEDAASQVFTRVMTALPRFTDREASGAFRAWLFRIAHNVVVDAVRAGRGHEPLSEAVELPDPAPSPEEVAVAGDERRVLHALLAHLPPDQRRVVELRLAGLTAAEIAAVLGRNRAAVDSAQYRALTKLRALMGISPTATSGEAHDEHA